MLTLPERSSWVNCIAESMRSLGFATIRPRKRSGVSPRHAEEISTTQMQEPRALSAFAPPKDVLVVEDEPLVRIEAVDALADSGIMAWEASDASEALHLLSIHRSIGLVFTDVKLPGAMDGLDLAREVSTRHPDIGLILTSGVVGSADLQLPEAAAFLAKPYPTSRLVRAVETKLSAVAGDGLIIEPLSSANVLPWPKSS